MFVKPAIFDLLSAKSPPVVVKNVPFRCKYRTHAYLYVHLISRFDSRNFPRTRAHTRPSNIYRTPGH